MKHLRTKDDKEYQNKMKNYSEVQYTCKCGHKVIIPEWVEKNLCSNCGHYVFKNGRDEFEFRLKESMRR